MLKSLLVRAAVASGLWLLWRALFATWHNPPSWSPGQVPTNTEFNQLLRDNLNHLLQPPRANYVANQASDYTTTQTTFVDVDSTNFVLTITPAGDEIEVHFHGAIINSGGTRTYFDVLVGAARAGGDDGIIFIDPTDTASPMPISFTRKIAVTAGQPVTVKLQWKVASGTATLYAGAGTANADVHPQFWVEGK